MSRLNRLSAIFLTATFECATIQTGELASAQNLTAAEIVVVLPVLGGPTLRIESGEDSVVCS